MELETKGLLQQFLQGACDSCDTAMALQGVPEADWFLALASKQIHLDETDSASKLEKLKKVLANFDLCFDDKRTVRTVRILTCWHESAEELRTLPQASRGGRSPTPAANDAVDDTSGGGKTSPAYRVASAAELEIRPQDSQGGGTPSSHAGTNNTGRDHSNRRMRTGRGYDNGYLSPSSGSETSLFGLPELDKTPKNSEERDMIEGFEEKKDDDEVKSQGSSKGDTVYSKDQIDCVGLFVESLEDDTKANMLEKLKQCSASNQCLQAVKQEIRADVNAVPCDTNEMKGLRKGFLDWLADEEGFDLEYLKKQLGDGPGSPPPREVMKKKAWTNRDALLLTRKIKDEEESPLRPRNRDTNDLLEDPRSMPSQS